MRGKLVDLREAAEVLGVHPTTLWRAIQEGRVPGATRLRKRGKWLVPRAWLESVVGDESREAGEEEHERP